MSNVRMNIHVEPPLVSNSSTIKFPSLGESDRRVFERVVEFNYKLVMCSDVHCCEVDRNIVVVHILSMFLSN